MIFAESPVITYIPGLFKSIANVVFFQKLFICSWISILSPFKVIPIRYYALVPTFFPILEARQKIIFCYFVQLLLRCRLYLPNRSVASFFHGRPQFREQEKITREQIWGIRWLRQDYCVVISQKFAHTQRCVSRSIIMVQKSIFVLPKIRAFLTDCFAQIAHNLQVYSLLTVPP